VPARNRVTHGYDRANQQFGLHTDRGDALPVPVDPPLVV